MKVVILAGGMGTRISEYTKSLIKPIPKPMIKVNGKPIIHRIIDHYIKYGHREFIIALGYKGKLIKKYFKKKKFKVKINIKLVDTGLKTMTGGRLKRLKKYLKKETFMMTYGDGISDVNLKKLLKFHRVNKTIATLTAVRPPARFGAIKIRGKKVSYFKEKSKLDEGWINGGFFVFEPKVFDYIQNDGTYLEKEPLINLGKKNQLNAFKHYGYWQCMDTIRDKEILEKNLKIKELV